MDEIQMILLNFQLYILKHTHTTLKKSLMQKALVLF